MGLQLLFFILVFISNYVRPVISELDQKIVSGTDTNIKEYPHQGALTIKNKYFCGCTIISNRHFLTSGRCCKLIDKPEDAWVLVGSTNRLDGTQTQIESIAIHPQYNDPPFDNDMCVLTSFKEIKFNENVQAVKLAPPNRPVKDGSDVFATGWGLQDGSSNTLPTNLQVVKTQAVSQLVCSVEYPLLLTKNMMCAGKFLLGANSNNQGTCNGDSGGPLVQQCRSDCRCLVGITSLGITSCKVSSVFARISSQSVGDFICDQTGRCPGVFCDQ